MPCVVSASGGNAVLDVCGVNALIDLGSPIITAVPLRCCCSLVAGK